MDNHRARKILSNNYNMSGLLLREKYIPTCLNEGRDIEHILGELYRRIPVLKVVPMGSVNLMR